MGLLVNTLLNFPKKVRKSGKERKEEIGDSAKKVICNKKLTNKKWRN